MHSRLLIEPRAHGPLAVVDLGGDLDLPGATQLMTVVATLAGRGSRVVVCDLTGLAVPGLQRLLLVFPAAQRRSGPWPQSSLHLVAPPGELADRLTRLGMPRFLPVHASLQDAVGAAAADATETHCELDLGPDTSSPATARAAMDRLWPATRRERDVRRDGLLVVSELTTNAVRHARSAFTVAMALSPSRFAVGVTDQTRDEPVVGAGAGSGTGGRGLQMVASLSQAWGVRLVHDYSKTVWATLDRPRRPGSAALAALPSPGSAG